MTAGPRGSRRAPSARGRRRRRWLGLAVDVLLPRACVGCGRGLESGQAPVCQLCWHRLPALPPPWCGRCGATTSAGRLAAEAPRTGCGECLEWPNSLPAGAAPYRMEGEATRLVHALKYAGWRQLATPMGEAMAASARRLAGPGPTTLVPVPLSPARRRERGFNQATLLAEALARAAARARGADAAWRVERLLARRPGGRRQARLGRRGREANVAARFALTGAAARAPAATGHHESLLLVDDVLTTGATAGACATALAEAGLPCRGVVTFARATRPFEL